jgi:sialate O-acetylesterase
MRPATGEPPMGLNRRTWRVGMRGLAACVLGFGLAAGARAEPVTLLHPMFQDHAVLQRDAPIRVFGTAAPGAAVDVTFAAERARGRADAAGRWMLELPARPAGGPFELVARAGATVQRVDDVLVGDVWLCSGQSNMVHTVRNSLDAPGEIARASHPRIRVMTVGETGSAVPLERFATPVQWRPATPEVAGDFSAACFFFARELQPVVDVPMGLVVAAWGGSRIEAWIRGDALRRLGGFDEELAILARYAVDPVAAAGAWGTRWAAWWSGRPGVAAGDAPWDPNGRGGSDWHTAPPALGAWERWGEPSLANFNGMLWYRTRVQLDAAQARQDAQLVLGPADEMDVTWVNGRGVGSSYGAGDERRYPLPRGLLRAGTNEVVVNVLDTWQDGGLAGPASRHHLAFADGSRVALDGAWQYRRVDPAVGYPPRAPWHTAAGTSTLHNGMLAPIGPFGFRGFVWYQGESNTGEPATYGALLGALAADLRSRHGARLAFLNVQLANFGMPPTRPAESGWAGVREAQRRHRELDPAYGLAVAIDIGDRYDVHPPNKQEVGRRLARAARHVVYGERTLSPSGPVPRAAERGPDGVRVRFGELTGSLVVYGAATPIGFELCDDSAAGCAFASARLEADAVVLEAPNRASATRVRYAWADSPVVNLYDASGLPAGPFEIRIAASCRHSSADCDNGRDSAVSPSPLRPEHRSP